MTVSPGRSMIDARVAVMDSLPVMETKPAALSRFFARPFARVFFYLGKRLVSVLLTVILGIFVTIVLANSKTGQVDAAFENAAESDYRAYFVRIATGEANDMTWDDLELIRQQIYAEAGLNLSFWPRQLLWTYRSLGMDWGAVRNYNLGYIEETDVKSIVLEKMPNTLLLIGLAYLLVFLVGLPLALRLSQANGKWYDKMVSALTPLSSIPSWVLGVLLVMLFAVQLKWLPVTKMTDSIPPETWWDTLLMLARHLALPVASIFLSLFFQLVYAWKTFLVLYSDEDYVELGRAKGLAARRLERNYILRPSLPYMLTTFAMTLTGFWQTVTALEFYFDWPGIGSLYVRALPNWLGESMFTGEPIFVVAIVVVFAYLLGTAVFLLDLLYVLVDPRIRLTGQAQTLRLERARKQVRSSPVRAPWLDPRPGASKPGFRLKDVFLNLQGDWSAWAVSIRPVWNRVRHSPSAVIGLTMVALLAAGSVLTVVLLPYNEYGRNWTLGETGENIHVPRLALPVWVNWFRENDLPTTQVLSSAAGQALKTVTTDPGGITRIGLTYTFEYEYVEFPQGILVYFSVPETEKKTFVALTWNTPDGREYHLSNDTLEFDGYLYGFAGNVPYRPFVLQNENWMEWFTLHGAYPTPDFYILFADPAAQSPRALPGMYTLQVDATAFEENATLDAEVVLLGQVHGAGGTDSRRRDLMVPLLWGLPYALFIGVVGAVGTTLLSLLLAATGVWLGGWVDGLLQRLIEANIILPVIAIAVIFMAFYRLDMWTVMGIIIVLNAFGGPTKAFRAAFLQVRESPYIEAAQTYGAGSWRIITRYLIPRILPVMIPQMVTLIPSFVFLEATLAIFGVSDPRYPTWGKVLFSALRYGASYGSRFWVLEPIALLLLTGLAFVLLGFTLNRILNPRLLED